jgi:predicted transcriptional regulator
MLNLPVSDIMNDHPIKVKSDVSIRNVAHLLLRYRINGILVVDPENMDLLTGVFTTADFLNLMDMAITSGAQKMQALNAISDRPVSDFINRQFLRLQQTDTTAKAIGYMHKHNVLTIPVYDGDKLVGVVGRHDVINIAFA